MPDPIVTDRLIVRAFRPDDWRDLHAYLSRPETFRFEPGEPIDEAEARRLALARSTDDGFRAIELRADGRVVGHLTFLPLEPARLRTVSLGFILGPDHQGRGYVTEAARALIDHAFADGSVHRVVAECDPENVASWRVLDRLGFEREGHLRRNLWFRTDPDGRPIWQDTLVYALLNPAEAG